MVMQQRLATAGLFHGARRTAVRARRFAATIAAPSRMDVPEIAPGKTRVGWIGTGVMGQSMCAHLIDKGFSVSVYNRTASKAESLVKRGAFLANSPAIIARRSDVVITMVGYPADVRQTVLDEESGVLSSLSPGSILIDMTTSEPSLAREISAAAIARGCHSIDAPVSGGDKGAKSATLSIMVGGEVQIFNAVAPLLRIMGAPTYMGESGAGQSCKLGNQVIIASTMIGMVEGLLFAHRSGLDLETYIRAVSGGAAGSKSLELYAGRIMQRDMEPGFYINHFVKDLGIALQECNRLNLCLPGLALAQQLYVSLKAHDSGHLGTQALVLALERLNNLELPKIEKQQ